MSSPSRLVACAAYATVGLWLLLLPSACSGQSFTTPKEIDDYLQTHPSLNQGGPSTIAGNGNPLRFIIDGLAYNVDPRLTVAIAGAESSLGTKWNACPSEGLNAWSWFYNGTCANSPFGPFGTYAGGIRVVTKWLRLSYLEQPKIKTITDIQNVGHYCEAGCADWITNVTKIYTDLHGDLSNLGFQPRKVFFDDIEGGVDGWTATGFWHRVTKPDTIRVNPEIYPGPTDPPGLVTLARHNEINTLADDGHLPTASTNPRRGVSAWWYGEDSTGTFIGSDFRQAAQSPLDGGTSLHPNSGDLITPPIDLTCAALKQKTCAGTGLLHAYLVFWTWWEIESVDANAFDIMDEFRIDVSTGTSFDEIGKLNPQLDVNGPPDIPFVSAGYDIALCHDQSCQMYDPPEFNLQKPRKPLDWMPVGADLTPYVGQQVRIRFHFDTRDQLFNGFRGWLIDDVAVFGIPFDVTTLASTSITNTGAVLNGSIDSNITPGCAYFEFGTDLNLTNASRSPTFQVAATNATQHFSTSVSLSPNMIYYDRIVFADSSCSSVLQKGSVQRLNPQ